MLIKAKTTIGDDVAIVLNGNDDLIVGRNVTLISSDQETIQGSGNNQNITVAGLLKAGDDGVHLEAAAPGGRAVVIFEATAVVIAADDAAQIDNQAFTIVNHGLLSTDFAFYVNDSAGNSRIVNTGTVLTAAESVLADVGGTLTFVNSGRVFSGSGLAYSSDGASRDVVLNRGLIRGDIDLGDGSDLYDGRGGRVVGDIFGGSDEGNDAFIPGTGAEAISGGPGVDTLDFRNSGGVRAALDFEDAPANTGVAKGDFYAGIERMLGSLKEADTLSGSRFDEQLRGFGGNDVLTGKDGSDTLVGGAGRDRLNSGGDTGAFGDTIIYNRLSEGGDRITGFGSEDEIFIDGSAFGGGLALGDVPESRFDSGADNRAGDAGDRFIFRTGDATLWFDRDGSRGGFAPVLIADFGNGFVFDPGDLTIF